jgi:hypothetical protein
VLQFKHEIRIIKRSENPRKLHRLDLREGHSSFYGLHVNGANLGRAGGEKDQTARKLVLTIDAHFRLLRCFFTACFADGLCFLMKPNIPSQWHSP